MWARGAARRSVGAAALLQGFAVLRLQHSAVEAAARSIESCRSSVSGPLHLADVHKVAARAIQYLLEDSEEPRSQHVWAWHRLGASRALDSRDTRER